MFLFVKEVWMKKPSFRAVPFRKRSWHSPKNHQKTRNPQPRGEVGSFIMMSAAPSELRSRFLRDVAALGQSVAGAHNQIVVDGALPGPTHMETTRFVFRVASAKNESTTWPSLCRTSSPRTTCSTRNWASSHGPRTVAGTVTWTFPSIGVRNDEHVRFLLGHSSMSHETMARSVVDVGVCVLAARNRPAKPNYKVDIGQKRTTCSGRRRRCSRGSRPRPTPGGSWRSASCSTPWSPAPPWRCLTQPSLVNVGVHLAAVGAEGVVVVRADHLQLLAILSLDTCKQLPKTLGFRVLRWCCFVRDQGGKKRQVQVIHGKRRLVAMLSPF